MNPFSFPTSEIMKVFIWNLTKERIFCMETMHRERQIFWNLCICAEPANPIRHKDKEMIRFQNEEAHIRMMVKKGRPVYKIDMHLRKNKAKGVAINGIPIKKARELLGVVNLVFFSPEDLNIIKNGPGERRRFLDLELCQLDSVYITDLTGYNHIVNRETNF